MAFTEGKYVSDVVKYEGDRDYSRETVTILAGSGSARALTAGMVVGRVTKGVAVGAAVAGNTGGSGAITAAPTVGAAAKFGTYRLVCIEPATNLGKFSVEDPDGIVIGVATVGTEFTTHLTFTIADATDFVSGDSFTIVVAAGSGKVKQIDFAATDGSDKAYGVLLFDATAADGADGSGVAVVRHAIVETSNLIWPSGASAPQKAAALATLETAGVLSRAGV